METAASGIGIGTVSNLFLSAIQFFSYYQLGKRLGSDVQTTCLQLDNSFLKLTRWGQAVGLVSHLRDAKSLKDSSLAKQDTTNAEQLLGHIVNLFEQAENMSSKYRKQPEDVGDDPAQVLTGSALALHRGMQDICRRRQKKTSLARKSKWVLHDKAVFDDLVNNVGRLVDDLVDLYPGAKPSQQELSNVEASELADQAGLPALQQISDGNDDLLKQAVAKLTDQRVARNTYFNNFDNTQVGNQGGNGQVINGGMQITFK